ncbi:hypothetical protein LWC34_45190 [Kibdelosporangium philippinense]|uniref:PE family protein n=2 Tax=Kibdelosporangium philippinense TaxID=211113 RepID=A0ABS8ZSJ3_9PSEU|nr:hypothetical protein [Kibdelosporangium philippinense]MCE7009955.1 hypothetical protein [Kibdelosporangium philippinense]
MPAGFEQDQGQPATAGQQIDTEIAVTQSGRAIAGVLGGEYHHQSGGGGAGGYYEFTSLGELDSIITRLKAVREKIYDARNKFAQAIGFVEPPAQDVLSVLQANATRNSLQLGLEHNRALLREADAAIAKFESSRKQYASTEHSVTSDLKSQYRG